MGRPKGFSGFETKVAKAFLVWSTNFFRLFGCAENCAKMARQPKPHN